MSDFKRKIEIVESTTPPSNKYNWWFNPNTNELQRYREGNWELYNYTWPTTTLPPANEIWLDLDSCYDPSTTKSNIKTQFTKIGTINDVDIISRDDDSALVKIIFNQNLTDITVTQPIYLSSITDDSSIKIIFPNLGSINYAGSGALFRVSGEYSVDFLFGNITSISGSLLEVQYNSTYITIYAKDVPTIQSNLIESSEEEHMNVSVSVPNSLVNKYKSSTNWAQYDITSID